jgi:hypothetical protein
MASASTVTVAAEVQSGKVGRPAIIMLGVVMRSLLVGAFLFVATASQASAQITYSSLPGAPDPGFGAQQLLVNFNGALPAGVTLSGSYSLQTGLLSGLAAPPAGNTSRYLAVPNANAGPSHGTAVIDFSGFLATQSITALSFYWGSIDTYNSLRFLDASGNALAITGVGTVLTGSHVGPPANGDQGASATNRRVFFDLSSTPTFAKLELTSNGRAFEIDDIAVASATVPEPGTYALMAAGLLGLAGVARRRRA